MTPEDRPLTPPSNVQQNTLWMLRSSLTQALTRDWDTIRAASPRVAQAEDNINRYLRAHPHRSFKVFRPEDASATVEAASPLFLR